MIEIYADVVFFINWVMDLFIFALVGLMAGRKPKIWRIISGAFVCAFLYCVLIFTPLLSPYYNFFSSLIVLLSGILVAFGLKDIKDFIKLILFAHVAAFAVGGVGSALFYYSNMGDVIGNAIGLSMNYFSVKTLIAAVFVSYTIIKVTAVLIGRLSIKKQAIYNIKIFFGAKSVEIPMLVDTGNTLLEPVSKDPVIIIEYDYIKEFLPPKLNELYISGKESDLSLIISAVSGESLEKHIRMIPFKSLGNENGMLIGFRPSMVQLEKEDGNELLGDMVIGIYNLSLSSDGRYHGLLNPAALNTNLNLKRNNRT